MNRRNFVQLTGSMSALGVAGCLTDPEPTTDDGSEDELNAPTETVEEPSPTDTERPTQTPAEDAEITASVPPNYQDYADIPDYGQVFRVKNWHESDIELPVRVTHVRSGERVYEDEITAPAEERTDVFHFSTLEDEYGDVERFEVWVQPPDGLPKSVEIFTNACYMSVRLSLDPENSSLVYLRC